MIGKPEWFVRRKYTGWGANPKTWQGWVYILVMILPIVLITNIGTFGTLQLIFIIVWSLIFIADFIDILIHMKRDEREKIHEAIAERNALWAIVFILGIGIAYQAASAAITKSITFVDPVIFIALIVGMIVKTASNIYLDKKD
jgi:purine-cytosine permease-like protein